MSLCVSNKLSETFGVKEIGDGDPYYSIKISIFSFIWAGLAALHKQAQYNEGCAKLNYSLPEV